MSQRQIPSFEDEMSKSRSVNPAKRFLTWASKKEVFQYWDKTQEDPETGEKGVNVEVDLPFVFLFVQRAHTVKRYGDTNNAFYKEKGGWYSNEVLDLSKDKMCVRFFKNHEVIVEGLYRNDSEVKDVLSMTKYSGKYTLSVYAVDKNGDLVNICLTGPSAFRLNDFINKNKMSLINRAIKVKSFTNEVNGQNEYTVPVFELGPDITPEKAELRNQYYLDITNHIMDRQEEVDGGKEYVPTDAELSSDYRKETPKYLADEVKQVDRESKVSAPVVQAQVEETDEDDEDSLPF